MIVIVTCGNYNNGSKQLIDNTVEQATGDKQINYDFDIRYNLLLLYGYTVPQQETEMDINLLYFFFFFLILPNNEINGAWYRWFPHSDDIDSEQASLN